MVLPQSRSPATYIRRDPQQAMLPQAIGAVRVAGKITGAQASMARLTTLKPTLTSVSATIGYAPTTERERDQHRDTQHWRKWYRTARWKKLRWATLVRDRFTCQRCRTTQHDTSKLVADHDQPHRGDERLFWQASNIVTLCKPCHDGAKQREERRGG